MPTDPDNGNGTGKAQQEEALWQEWDRKNKENKEEDSE